MCRRVEACNRRSTPSSRAGRFDWPQARPIRAPSRCRPKAEAEYILITTATALPPPGARIDPSYKPSLATIRSSTTSSALSTAAGASYYRIVGVAFEANQNGSGDIIALGRADQTTLASIPHHIELDRVLIAGNPSVGQKRAIAANAISVSILNSAYCGHQGRGAGLPGDCRVEFAGTVCHSQQLPRGGGREHPLWRRGHHGRWRYSQRHHRRGQRPDEESRLARQFVDGQEHLRAEERQTRCRPPQPDALQLGRFPDRICRRLHAAELERPHAVGRGV